MQPNKEVILGICAPRAQDRECETTTDFPNSSITKKKYNWYESSHSTIVFRYCCLFILGSLSWGLLWLVYGDDWTWDGPWSRIALVGVAAWCAGQILEGLTTLPPLMAAIIIGILCKHFGFLDMRGHTDIDSFLRKIYPVLILGKGSLGWDLDYMGQHWQRVAALGVLPWTAEVLTMAVCTHLALGFPWLWGLLLGSVYASVSCPVIMASVSRVGAVRGRSWPRLVGGAGGVDTALSVGCYGLVLTLLFGDSDDIYTYVKAALALPGGVALGAAWGCVAGRLPRPRDRYVTQLRLLLVLLGGLFANFLTSHVGWGGTAGVAVLVCNATAAHCWKKDGWKPNDNPVSTAYRVLWASAEPLLFAYTGTFFELNAATGRTLIYGLGILAICLTVRLTAVTLVCWDMTVKEKIFLCSAWTPKSIVEAVLGPVAINALLVAAPAHAPREMQYAEDILRLLVQAILITTPIGFSLTHYLGPWLLRNKIDVDNPR